ncbi:MAG TPA: tyrosine-type recombinase/integrase [Candidatus Acidoferrum sp.]|nr:tyrosine-type recombinase/integrase [Candidatus Acidoferrum sp.]
MHALTKDELRRLLSTAKVNRERDWLMILVAFHHGLRASEVVGITADAVVDGFLTVQRLKGSNKTTQALVASVDPLLDEREALIEFVRKSKPGSPVFGIGRVQFWRLVKRYARAARIPQHKAHPHVLKHSIAMQTIDRAGVENVRQHLGHKSLSSTGEYLKVSDEEAGKRISEALNV